MKEALDKYKSKSYSILSMALLGGLMFEESGIGLVERNELKEYKININKYKELCLN